MPSIYLIRHGKASPQARDYDELSPTGHEQARLLGAELARRGLRPAAVLSGSLRRQRQTARTALAGAGIDAAPVVDERWNEYGHLELLARSPAAAGTLQERLDAGLSAWIGAGGAGPGSWEGFRGGVLAALEETAAGLGRGESALVFTSAGVVATVAAALLRAPEHGFLELNRIVVNGSLTKVVHGRGGTRLLSFNDHAHLERDGEALTTFR